MRGLCFLIYLKTLLPIYKLALGVACIFLLQSGSISPLWAQTTNSDSTNVEDVVRRVRFSGNDFVKDRTLENLIRTRTNREFLGIPRFTPWYFIWKASNGRFGEDPSYLDRQIVENDMERIALYYESLGFLNVKVDTTIVEFRADKIEVSFIINEGEASRMQSLSYTGFPDFPNPEIKRRFFIQSPLTGRALNDSTYHVNQQYNSQELKNEQLRILSFLKNNGYASVDRDSVTAFVKQDSADALFLDVLFSIEPGSIYKFGDLEVKLADGTPPDNYSELDTLSGEPFTADTNKIFLAKEPETDTKFSLMSDQILFKPGETYNEELYLQTVKEFQNLGMLYIRRFGQNRNGVRPDFSKEEIPVYFDLETITKHSIGTELFGMKRYGFGTGLGVDYSNNNVFGKAERLSIGANASFEYVSSSTLEEIAPEDTVQSSLFRSYEVRGEYSVPRIAFPFSFLDNTRYFTSALTRYSLSYSRSDQLLFDINSDVRFNYQYEVQHNDQFSSFLDLIELDIVDTSPTDRFNDSLRAEFGENSLEYIRILQDFEPQISSVIRYTFRSQNTDLIKRNYGYFSEYSISAGGNIPYAIDRFIITPDTLESTLPPLFGLSNNELTYSRYVKLTADYRKYYPISNSGVFGWRLFGGIAHPYGKNETIPLNRRFFAGGSNDIRGWAPFQLGPGDIASDEVTINGGEIKLAAFTEARQIFLRDLIGANWHAAWFVDAGNIWYGPRNDFNSATATNDGTNSEASLEDELERGRFKLDSFYKQIAVGSGLGLRLDWEYVVVRFDFAFRAHDLQEGWFNNPKLYFSFGIGHSF
ncbi:MAG: BamA/TamA family outer membrane protein [Balneolaceae bacterium]|nr:BamA/TamA family outer membrane protein [Balneolaceae bacterium]MBO6546367.1 BamA/TamA family outer membrane protein [Balneolaceae bacterium]MBO6648726.1 BamA/TamA family outer membrane protein [Balneolaceae bacterium]